MDTYQAEGPGDIKDAAVGVGDGEGFPEALYHDYPVQVEKDPDLLGWFKACVARPGDAVDAGGEAGEDPCPQVQLPVCSPGPLAVVEVGQELVIGDGGVSRGPAALISTQGEVGQV